MKLRSLLCVAIAEFLLCSCGGGSANSPSSNSPSSAASVPSNSAPTISSLAPTAVTVGSPTFTLTVTGSGFLSSSTVMWDGVAVTTGYVSSTQLTAAVPASDVASAGTARVTVSNSSAATSSASTFTINASNPVPIASSLAPSSATARGTAFTLTVSGSGFVPLSTVQWNGTTLPTTYISDVMLTASVPASDIAAVANASVTVSNPAPGGGISSGATFTITASGSSSVPSAPTQLTAHATTEGATILFAAPSSDGGSALTQYTATSNPGGISASTVATTTPVAAISARIDVNGLTAGVPYTFTVTASNANGTGPTSVSSNAVTPTPYADYWLADGGTVTGRNPAWGDYSYSGLAYYGVTPGTSAHNGSGHSAPSPLTSGTNVIELDVASSYGGLQPYYMHINPATTANGRFNLAPYAYLTFSVWPTVSGQTLAVAFKHSYWYNGVATSGTNNTTALTDSGQIWPANQFADGTWFLRDNTASFGPSQITANTATMLTFKSAPAPVATGDYYEIDKADQAVGLTAQLPNASYGPATMTPGQWNTYSIPLTAFDASSGAKVAGTLILKFAIIDGTGASSNTLYFCNLGFR